MQKKILPCILRALSYENACTRLELTSVFPTLQAEAFSLSRQTNQSILVRNTQPVLIVSHKVCVSQQEITTCADEWVSQGVQTPTPCASSVFNLLTQTNLQWRNYLEDRQNLY